MIAMLIPGVYDRSSVNVAQVAQAVVGNPNCLGDQNGKYSIQEIIEIARGGNKIAGSSPRFRRNRRIEE